MISTYVFVPYSSSLPGGAVAEKLHFGLQIVGDSSSQIVSHNFSNPRLYLKAPKAKTASFDTHNVGGNPYELLPLPKLLALNSPLVALLRSPLMIVAGSDDIMPVVESLRKRLEPPPVRPNLNAIPILRPQRAVKWDREAKAVQS